MSYIDRSAEERKSHDGLELSERHKLMNDGLVNNMALVVSGLVGIVLVPLMLKWLGAESYGIWIVALATTALLSRVDLGLYPTVVREVASASDGTMDDERCLFLEGAANAYLLLGAVGALLLGIVGYLLAGHLNIGPQLQETAHAVLWLIGLGFCFDQLTSFGGSVLIGLRRFGYANLIRSGAAIFRALGIVVILALGGSLISIALWQVAAAVAGAAITLFLVRRLMPQLRFRIGHLHLDKLRQRLSFAISSLLTTTLGGLVWESGSLLIGVMLGSASVVPFYIGRKFPYMASGFGWQTAEGVFPAAAANQESLSRSREILKVGTRWVLVLMLPIVVLLWVVGPNLLSVWIGTLNPETLVVLRLMSWTALTDAFMAASLNVLWGRAAMRQVVFTMLGVGVGAVCLTVGLLPRMGVVGAAWGALLPTIAGACVLFYLASRECQASLSGTVGSLLRGLPFAVTGCGLGAYLISVWAGTGIGPLISACLTGSIIYALVLYLTPGPNQEREFLQTAVRRVNSLR